MDAININQIDNINLEEKITCGKIKSKAKTLLVGKINKSQISNEETWDTLIIPTIKVNKIVINYTNVLDYEKICSYLINSTIIISNSSNPKKSNLHILVLPGHLCDIKKISQNQIEINMKFENFFPYNIPVNINDIHFMIWFKELLSDGLIKKTEVSSNLIDISINKSNICKSSFEVNSDCISVQQTQTFNIICKNKILDIVTKKTNFINLCKAFWIKFFQIDYNNLEEFNLELNGLLRFRLDKKQMELICEKKNIYDGYVLIFLNLELGSNDWVLPQDKKLISHMYSNSLNASRIDTIKWSFKFTNKFTHDNIQITSLSLDSLRLYDNNLDYKNIYLI